MPPSHHSQCGLLTLAELSAVFFWLSFGPAQCAHLHMFRLFVPGGSRVAVAAIALTTGLHMNGHASPRVGSRLTWVSRD